MIVFTYLNDQMIVFTYLADQVAELIQEAQSVWSHAEFPDAAIELLCTVKRILLVCLEVILTEKSPILKKKKNIVTDR